jgi:hypothetical protein
MTMTTAILRRTIVFTAAGLALAGAGCSDTVRQGRSASYLIIDKIEATAGSDTTQTGQLASDVSTKGTAFEDHGFATLSLGLKNIGPEGTAAAPTSNNFVTVTRYHVSYRRADGRNTPGVDVPYAFDGATTGTITESEATFEFVLVRAQAKLEAPLMNLVGGGGALTISSLADVTFYGRDQTGNDVQVTGSISVNFADWADPGSTPK